MLSYLLGCIRGVRLTTAGMVLQKHAKEIIRQVNATYEELDSLQSVEKPLVRIGTSYINSANRYSELWSKVAVAFPNYKFQYIPLNSQDWKPIYGLGTKTDIVIAPLGVDDLKYSNNIITTQISLTRVTIVVLNSNPLTKKAMINYDDLAGMDVYAPSTGLYKSVDTILKKMTKVVDNFHSTDNLYTLETFDQIMNDRSCLLSLDYWQNLRPDLVSIPFNSDIKIPVEIIINRGAPRFVKNVYDFIANAFQKQATK